MASKVLIIEDNAMNRALFRAVLRGNGFDIVEAENGKEGIQAAREHRPDLIIMDLQMPVMNGYEAAKVLKEDPRTAATPIVAVTAFAMEGDREKVLSLGFDYYVSKPFGVHQLANLIHECLAASRQG